MVEQDKKAPGGSGLSGSQIIKRRAELHAAAYASTIQELRSAGFVSRRALADELNRRGTPTARGGKWHYNIVVRMLKRLGLLTWGVPTAQCGKWHPSSVSRLLERLERLELSSGRRR
jgi:hypothetical protein